MNTSISTKLAALGLALMVNGVIVGGMAYLFNAQLQQPTTVISLASGAAQAWQNFARARLDAPHEGHGSGSGAAHSSQNFAPS